MPEISVHQSDSESDEDYIPPQDDKGIRDSGSSLLWLRLLMYSRLWFWTIGQRRRRQRRRRTGSDHRPRSKETASSFLKNFFLFCFFDYWNFQRNLGFNHHLAPVKLFGLAFRHLYQMLLHLHPPQDPFRNRRKWKLNANIVLLENKLC